EAVRTLLSTIGPAIALEPVFKIPSYVHMGEQRRFLKNIGNLTQMRGQRGGFLLPGHPVDDDVPPLLHRLQTCQRTQQCALATAGAAEYCSHTARWCAETRIQQEIPFANLDADTNAHTRTMSKRRLRP